MAGLRPRRPLRASPVPAAKASPLLRKVGARVESEASESGQEGMRAAVAGSSGKADVPKAALPVPATGSIVVPSPQQFEVARLEAREAGKSQDLHRMVSAMQAAAAKCDLAYEEMVRLAVYRLEVERDLGAHLAQTVARGRPTKRCPRGTVSGSGLPEGISKKQSVAYQRLAAIPVALFQRYLEAVREARKFPTNRGARAFASERKPRAVRPPKKARASRVTVDVDFVDAIRRCLGPVDVVVGSSYIPARRTMGALDELPSGACGQAIVVVGERHPDRVLPFVARLIAVGRFTESIVLLPRDLDAGWLRELNSGRWSVCLPVDASKCIAAHLGARSRAFKIVFDAMGPILEVNRDVECRDPVADARFG